MKKLYLIVLTVFAVSFTTPSQAQELNYGAKVGFLGSTMAFDNYTTNMMSFNYTIGAFVEYGFTDMLAAQAELMYEGLGTNETGHDDASSREWNYNVKMNYVSLPIALKVKPIYWLAIEAGPKFSYCIGGSEYDGDYSDYIINTYTLTKSEYNPIDISAFLGVEANISAHVLLGVRYSYGFKNALTEDFGLFDTNVQNYWLPAQNAYNRSMIFTLGYKL